MTIAELMAHLASMGKPDMRVVLSGAGAEVHEVDHVEVIGCILGEQGRHEEVCLADNPPGMTNAALLHSHSESGAPHVADTGAYSDDTAVPPGPESAAPVA